MDCSIHNREQEYNNNITNNLFSFSLSSPLFSSSPFGGYYYYYSRRLKKRETETETEPLSLLCICRPFFFFSSLLLLLCIKGDEKKGSRPCSFSFSFSFVLLLVMSRLGLGGGKGEKGEKLSRFLFSHLPSTFYLLFLSPDLFTRFYPY